MRGLLLLGGAALLVMAADAPTPPQTQPSPSPQTPPAPELTKADATGVLSRMVRDADGREIGRIVDVVVDPSGQPRAIVIDVGGFMGLGARRVAVSWASVHVPPPGAKEESVGIDLTDSQVRAAPDYTDRSKPATIVGPPTPAAAPAPEPPPPAPPPAEPPAAEPPAAEPPAPEPPPAQPAAPESTSPSTVPPQAAPAPSPAAPEAMPPASPAPQSPPPDESGKAGEGSK